VERIGAYLMIGDAAVTYRTSGGVPILSSGLGNKSFSREGFVGQFYFGKLDFQVLTQHGWDSAWFGAGYGDAPDGGANAAGATLPTGARAPTWNGYMVESHYTYSPQLIFIQRSEWERMSQQACPVGSCTADPMSSNLGNIDMYTFGYRYYPIMTSRAGFAWHNEYSWIRERGAAPDGSDLTSSSLLLGFDFDF
jgi:hypothetical protein